MIASGLESFRIGVRSGAWLTRERTRLIAFAVLAASLFGLAYLLATAHGVIDFQNRPLGTDFSNVYAAGTYVLEGRAAAPFDLAAQHAREQELFGATTPFYGWHYPPFFLFLAGLLALLPYGTALLVWQAASFALYLAAIRAVVNSVMGHEPRPHGDAAGHWWLLFATAFPAVFVNVGHGHNGFLTAALLAFALVSLDVRPIFAGVLFGLLAYKPQFGVMIPLVLVATGRWRVVLAAAATVGVLVAVTTLAFGLDVWPAFLASTHFTRVVVLEQGNTGWQKIQSVFSWVRMWGGPVPLAYAAQTTVALALAVALVRQWRSDTPFARKTAALCIAAILSTPYSLDYDMMVLAPAIAWLVADGLRRGFAPYEASVLAFLWLAPLVARVVAAATLIPLGVIAMIAAFVFAVRPFATSLGWAAPASQRSNSSSQL